MTAKELTLGMRIQTARAGLCEVLRTYAADKWLIVVMLDTKGRIHEVAKFPGSVVVVMGEEAHQP